MEKQNYEVKEIKKSNGEIEKVKVMKWPSPENPDKGYGRSGYDSLYK